MHNPLSTTFLEAAKVNLKIRILHYVTLAVFGKLGRHTGEKEL